MLLAISHPYPWSILEESGNESWNAKYLKYPRTHLLNIITSIEFPILNPIIAHLKPEIILVY